MKIIKRLSLSNIAKLEQIEKMTYKSTPNIEVISTGILTSGFYLVNRDFGRTKMSHALKKMVVKCR